MFGNEVDAAPASSGGVASAESALVLLIGITTTIPCNRTN
jgi:hypothetical protein